MQLRGISHARAAATDTLHGGGAGRGTRGHYQTLFDQLLQLGGGVLCRAAGGQLRLKSAATPSTRRSHRHTVNTPLTPAPSAGTTRHQH